LRKTVKQGSLSLLQRFPLRLLGAVAAVWLAALLIIPSVVLGLEAQGLLQTPAADLFPLSDKRLWGGLMLTMQLTVLGIGASFPIGLALALGRRSNLSVVKYACVLYIETVRGVPLITILFMAVLLVPLIDPSLATIENAIRAWVGIAMFSAAYLAENVRGGLQSLDRGQTEAAQAIGLSGWQTTLYILLPQALRAVIPALVGQFISLFKDTSLVFIVGLAEIVGIAVRVVAQPEFVQRRQETFLYVAIIFFVFSYIMSYISRRVEATGSGAARAQRL
jgi:general L-amino acid transport system permease protein